MDQPDKQKKRVTLINLSISFVTIIVMTVSVELTSLILIKKADLDPRPFLINTSTSGVSIKQTGGTGLTSYVDPHLGYSLDPTRIPTMGLVPGFAVYGDYDIDSDQMIRIIALGGSTTASPVRNNWPMILEEICNRESIAVQIFNGGIQGYSSNQELLKMIRDVLLLEPAVIISLNGVNEVGFAHALPKHPMVHIYQDRLLSVVAKTRDSFLFPNTTFIVRRWLNNLIPEHNRVTGINFGPEVQTTPPKQWKRNIRIMETVADEFGIKYLCFLQPVLGIGEYLPSSPEEENMLSGKHSYLNKAASFYQEARQICKELPYCIDLTDVFKGRKEMYHDLYHPNIEGYRMIAEAIFEELNDRGLLELYR